eukprot:TRINITY_DN48716_c0_g1_i1.p1 TRINITY_DN48716_c0_g1~~TRINITY_DN48716_c0_g1_i1.p1  ORF type:complete len:669 (-),score=149.20 TRINITY_DN48716_c0_g1_i1:156-2162(-)
MATRLQFRSPAEERAHWRSELGAVQRERDELAATAEQLRRLNADLSDAAASATRSAAEVIELRSAEVASSAACASAETALRGWQTEARTAREEANVATRDLVATRAALSDAEVRSAARSAESRQSVSEAQAAKAAAVERAGEQASAQHAAQTALRSAEDTAAKAQSELLRLRESLRDVNARADRGLTAETELLRIRGELAATRASEQEALELSDARARSLERCSMVAQQQADASEERARGATDRALDVERRLRELEALERSSRERWVNEAAEAAAEAEVRVAAEEARVRDADKQAAALSSQLEETISEAAASLALGRQVEAATHAVRVEAELAEKFERKATAEAEHSAEASKEAAAANAQAVHFRESLSRADIESSELRAQCEHLQLEFQQVVDRASSNTCTVQTEVVACSEAQAEVRRLREEVAQRGLEIEAHRLVQYDREREAQKFRERFDEQAKELEDLQTRFAIGMGAEEVMDCFGGAIARGLGSGGALGANVRSSMPRGSTTCVAGAVGSGRVAARAASTGRMMGMESGAVGGASGGASTRGVARQTLAATATSDALAAAAENFADGAGGNGIALPQRHNVGPPQPPAMPASASLRCGVRRPSPLDRTLAAPVQPQTARERYGQERCLSGPPRRESAKPRPPTPTATARSDVGGDRCKPGWET